MTAKKKKRGPGRPKTENPANARIGFRITPDQRARYEAAANASNLSLSAWIERVLDRAS